MKNKIVNLINKVQRTFGSGSFEILQSPTNYTPLYDLGDLTKNYVEFVTDLISEKFGDVNENVISLFGNTIQTDITNFPPSTISKPSTIKQINEEGIFISTNMNKPAMESMIAGLCEQMEITAKFNIPEEKGWSFEKVAEVYGKYKNKSELMKGDLEIFRIAIRNNWHHKASEYFGTPKVFHSQEERNKISELMKSNNSCEKTEENNKENWNNKRTAILESLKNPIKNFKEEIMTSELLSDFGYKIDNRKSFGHFIFDFYIRELNLCLDVRLNDIIPSDVELKKQYCEIQNIKYVIVERMDKLGIAPKTFGMYLKNLIDSSTKTPTL
jgi:hypothetical protein